MARPSKPSPTAVGAAAETLAAEFLRAQGLVIVARNLRCKGGELDLVCLEGELLVIVEVRQRARTDFGGAAASVTAHKQRKLIRATRFFWQRQPEWRARMLRFDVVALRIAPPAGALGSGTPGTAVAPEIEWIQDAFRAT